MKQKLAGIAPERGPRRPDLKVRRPSLGLGPQGLDPKAGRKPFLKKSEGTQNQENITLIQTQTHQSSRHHHSEHTLILEDELY